LISSVALIRYQHVYHPLYYNKYPLPCKTVGDFVFRLSPPIEVGFFVS
jgi:hypothetical protein